MHSTSSANTPLRKDQEWVLPIPWTKIWYVLVVSVHVAIIAPYLSNLIPHLNKEGLFPVRPLHYMLGLGLIHLALLARKSPDFTRTGLILLLLLSLRAADAAFLQRPGSGIGEDNPALGFTGCVFMAAVILSSVGVFHKTTFLPTLLAALATILLVAGSVLAEFFGFGTFTTVPGRAAGFPGDANDACMNMNLMLAVVLSISRRFWWNIGLMGVVLCAVIPTLSRGGFLVFTLIAGAFFLFNLRKHGGKFVLIGLIAVPLALGGISLVSSKAASGGTMDRNARSRLSGLFGGDLDKLQSGERIKDLTDGLHAAMEKPLFGLGSGAGQTLYQPHNQLVTIWLDIGLLGALLFAGMIAVLALKSVGSGFAAFYCVIPLVLYIPLAQTLLDNFAYYYAAAIVMCLTSTNFMALRLHRPPSAA